MYFGCRASTDHTFGYSIFYGIRFNYRHSFSHPRHNHANPDSASPITLQNGTVKSPFKNRKRSDSARQGYGSVATVSALGGKSVTSHHGEETWHRRCCRTRSRSHFAVLFTAHRVTCHRTTFIAHRFSALPPIRLRSPLKASSLALPLSPHTLC